MSAGRIPKALRELVAGDARHRCGYCLTAEAVVGAPMELDHLIPRSLGGPTERDNLWLACGLCNEHKASRIAAHDPNGGELVRFFDPRRHAWSEHFSWTEAGERIVGLTPTGRVTALALRLNRAPLVHARRRWVIAGWHPPRD